MVAVVYKVCEEMSAEEMRLLLELFVVETKTPLYDALLKKGSVKKEAADGNDNH